ncbi:DUF6714 family protein [Povalibacter sp.]|uniref:DUF6714 family protein n=1 Tax=Povalibacter sp. TaxID=1962978 RepID=UPI002F401330
MTSTEDAQFSERLYAAFAAAARPALHEITPHRCWACDAVRARLARHQSREVPIADMEWLGDSLPLLGPKALRYYLPRYFEFSLTHRHSTACESVLYHLTAEQPASDYWAARYGVFSPGERDAIVEYLRYRAAWPDAEIEQERLERGLRFWSGQQG